MKTKFNADLLHSSRIVYYLEQLDLNGFMITLAFSPLNKKLHCRSEGKVVWYSSTVTLIYDSFMFYHTKLQRTEFFLGWSAIHCLSSTFLISVRSKFQFTENSGVPRFKPGTAGWEARTLPLCYAVPPFNEQSLSARRHNLNHSIRSLSPSVAKANESSKRLGSWTLRSRFEILLIDDRSNVKYLIVLIRLI